MNSNCLAGLVALFNGISILCGLFNARAIPVEEQYLYYSSHSWRDKGVHTFFKGISLKVNAQLWLEFKLTYYDVTVQCVSHYAMGTTPE